MLMSEIQDPKIAKLWSIYQSAMWYVAGRRVNLPKNTDPTKTYQYRWMQGFDKQLHVIGAGDALAEKMIYAVVRWAKSRNKLQMGASILAMQKVLQICHESLIKERHAVVDFGRELLDSKNFILRECGGHLRLEVLVQQKAGGYANIVYWLKSNKVSFNYASLSRICHDALNVIERRDPDQRREMPSNLEFLKRRLRILSSDLLQGIVINELAEDFIGGRHEIRAVLHGKQRSGILHAVEKGRRQTQG
jgi:hypothetical protein